MLSKITLAFFCITLLLSSSFLSADQPDWPKAVPGGFGFNIHFTDPKPGEMEMMTDSGVTMIRMDFFWNAIEKEKGVYDFSAYDRLTDTLDQFNIRPIYILDYSNRHYDNDLSPHTPEGRRAFAKWAAASVEHFKGRGILWEMYNEPNIHFWRPKPNTEDYVLLALETGKAIRGVAPDEIYIGPATSQVDLKFLEDCFKAGLLEYWNAVSVHPYRRQTPETVIPEYAKLRELIDRYAPKDKNIPILSAEWGYSSGWESFDELKQGKMLVRQWLTNLACDIPVSIWYDWHDDGTDPGEPEHHFGTTLHDYRDQAGAIYDSKSAYLAAKTFLQTLRGFSFNKRLFIGDAENYVFLFNRGDEIRLVAWTTAEQSRKVTIPCDPGRFQAVSFLGENLSQLSANDQGLTVMLSDAPVYLIPEQPNALLRAVAEWVSYPIAFYNSPHDRKNIAGTFPFPLPDKRRVTPVSVEVAFEKSEKIFKQVSDVYSPAPFVIHAPFVEGDQLVIRMDNPSQAPFSGTLELDNPIGIELAEFSKDATFDGTNQCVDLFFSIKEHPKKEYQVTVSLNDSTNCVFQSTQKIVVVDDFTGQSSEKLNQRWSVTPDGDANVGSEQNIELAENGTLRVNYKFDEGWKYLKLELKRQFREWLAGKPMSLNVRCIGDGSGNTLRLRFTDSTYQTFQVDGPLMAEKGVSCHSFPLDGSGAIHWGGANDGKIHYPIRFDSLIIDGTRQANGPNSIDFFPLAIVTIKNETEETNPCYLFSYFTGNGEDGLHLAMSTDGYIWTPLNRGKPFLHSEIGKDKIMRDPSICQGPDGMFHMVWSASWTGKEFGYACSKDLTHWSAQKAIPAMTHEPSARNTWAPEVFFDNNSELFYIFWASTVPEKFSETKSSSEDDYNHRMYYTTTKDFESFTPSRLYFDPGHSVIDAFLAKEGDEYLLFYKDETLTPEAKKNIVLAIGNSPTGPFTLPKIISHENWVEGPAAIKIGDTWFLYYDCYIKGRYSGVKSDDLKTWTDISNQLDFPINARHGTVFRVKPEIIWNMRDQP